MAGRPALDSDLAPLHVVGFSRCAFPFRHRRIVFGLVVMDLDRRLGAIERALLRRMNVMMR